MPLLPGAAWRPKPEVELLSSKTIKIKEVVKKLETFVESAKTQTVGDQATTLGAASIKVKQLPLILAQLQAEWLNRSEEEAKKLNCFVQVQARLEVHLHPRYIGEKLAEGLRHAAFELLLHHSEVLGCIPLCFLDLKPTGSHGALVSDSPWVHFLVDLNAVGLVLKPGQHLLAKLQDFEGKSKNANKSQYLNLLLLDYFSCRVHAHHTTMPAGLTHDPKLGWLDSKSKKPLKETMGPLWLKFTEFLTTYNKDVLSMACQLEWPPATSLEAKAEKKKLKADDERADGTEENGGAKEKKEKKARKSLEGAEPEPTPKKKKKKDKEE
eukprot:TRINITY_DN111299_c0_g1_i1.p1 TRINITY_DN111299_c0_g1~~TRINITY_DN111299_c0_g1_i1.p1  ORF type:complete len:324 (+),score=104.48 TRINITY_DN111299_c0_g1_i1:124-1095(+)